MYHSLICYSYDILLGKGYIIELYCQGSTIMDNLIGTSLLCSSRKKVLGILCNIWLNFNVNNIRLGKQDMIIHINIHINRIQSNMSNIINMQNMLCIVYDIFNIFLLLNFHKNHLGNSLHKIVNLIRHSLDKYTILHTYFSILNGNSKMVRLGIQGHIILLSNLHISHLYMSIHILYYLVHLMQHKMQEIQDN